MREPKDCPECGYPEYADFIDAVGQCGDCEAGIYADDCYHLDNPYPDHADADEQESAEEAYFKKDLFSDI